MDTSRRSSRASRKDLPAALNNTSVSSASSNASSRGDRNTRASHNAHSPRRSDSAHSGNGSSAVTSSRAKRARVEDEDAMSKGPEELPPEFAAAGDDDDAVRCICGFDDYPGPPQIHGDNKHGVKDGIEAEGTASAVVVGDDLSGFYVQCDTCNLWQHGGCVGITDADSSPEEYFCELCRPDLHRIATASNGQRYSYYLPLHPSVSRTTSRAPSHPKDGHRSPRDTSRNGRAGSSMQNAKRRSTMNSREGAYNEEEQIRLAIEASKADNHMDGAETNGRRGKRGRSDSAEKSEQIKKQRTSSPSPSRAAAPSIAAQPTVTEPQSEHDAEEKARVASAKKGKGAANRNNKDQEAREERERIRQEAANKRKGRAERRRAEDSDPSDDTPLAEQMVAKAAPKAPDPRTVDPPPPPSSIPAVPGTPPTQPSSTTQKKTARSGNGKKSRVGRNQYTKDRDGDETRSPHRSQSREVGKDTQPRASDARQGRAKASPGSKLSMNDMRRRVTSILDFISRTQIEMAGDSTASSPSASALQAERMLRHVAEGLPMPSHANGDAPTEDPGRKEFKDLTCLEMMDVLTRQLVKWQQEFT